MLATTRSVVSILPLPARIPDLILGIDPHLLLLLGPHFIVFLHRHLIRCNNLTGVFTLDNVLSHAVISQLDLVVMNQSTTI